LSATVAGKRTEFDLSFTEPYFLDRDFSAGLDAFHTTRDLQDESSYDQKRTGGGLRFGYPLSEKWRQGLGYRLEQNEIYNVQSDASRFVRDQEGQRLTSAVSQRLTYDARNSTMFPTDGLYSWLDAEVAGLGGDAKYVSGKLGSSWYYPVADHWTLNLLGEGGAIQGWGEEDVQINERYFLGGTTLRGFSRGGVGPRDTTTNDSLGGNLFYRGTAEMAFPVGLPEEMGVAGHAFTDVGSLWSLDEISSSSIADESTLRGSAGLGVSWKSPIGPVRADFSIPYLKEDFDDEQPFQFNFGTRF
jgi:outer membrane protein insertion porin family